MSKQLKLRRGTTVQHASFTGGEGEITVDTTRDTVVVHDGSTAGGHPLLKDSDYRTSTTGSAKLPAGTTAERDGSPVTGYMRFNSTLSKFEGYNGSAWGLVGATDGQDVNFTQSGTGAAERTVTSKLREFVSVKDFGAVGDGVTDDTAAIQAAINYISPTTYNATTGGGQVFFPPGKYRITSGLVVGWGTRLVGTGSGGFPYNGTNTKHSMIVADFGSNVNQWIIDSATYNKPAGTRVAYNAFVDMNIDGTFTSCHQVGIEGLHITCVDQTTNIIYGGVRLVGCPNSEVRDVTVLGCGIAFQLNTSFVSEIANCHSETHYYGVVLYESNNACKVDGYFNKIINPSSLSVPAGRVLSFIPDAAALTSTSFGLDASHATSAKGLIIAAAGSSSSQMAECSVTLEYWPDVVFLLNAYSTLFKTLYTESSYVNYVLTGAYCSAVIEEHSVYAVNAKGFDVGYNCVIDARIQGLYRTNSLFANISDDSNTQNGTKVTIRGLKSYGNTQHARVSYESEAKPVAYLSFNGSDLSIKNSYNISGVSRVSGEPWGDYWIDFRRPSNAMSNNGEPVVSISLSGYGFGVIWLGGGDGIQNTRIRVRCMNLAGVAFDPSRVMITIYG